MPAARSRGSSPASRPAITLNPCLVACRMSINASMTFGGESWSGFTGLSFRDDTREEVGGGAEGGLSLEVGLDEAVQRRAVARSERAVRGVGGRSELLYEERPVVVVAPRLSVDQERDPAVSAQLDRRGAVLERPGTFEDRPGQVETDVEQPRAVSQQAAFGSTAS